MVLFFGNIAPYKGLEFLVDAMQRLWGSDPDFRLVIAGRPKKGAERYWHGIHQVLEQSPDRARVIEFLGELCGIHVPQAELTQARLWLVEAASVRLASRVVIE